MWYLILSAIYLSVYSYSIISEYNRNRIFNNFNKEIKFHEGLDMRYPEEFKDLEEISKINNYFIKYRLLKSLENKNISSNYKISLIEGKGIIETSYSPNILAGGLFNDYNYTF